MHDEKEQDIDPMQQAQQQHQELTQQAEDEQAAEAEQAPAEQQSPSLYDVLMQRNAAAMAAREQEHELEGPEC